MIKIYRVGGCVRDTLLNIQPKDIDYVVVGATHEYMIANSFTQVGAAFPVYLKHGEEYALARRESKVGVGYNGFKVQSTPDITLEEDLSRRDITINSMAMDEEGTIIDPYGGQADLKAGLIRHTSVAFSEDPVRVLRAARFAARYGFKIHPDTIKLMSVVAPELDHVVPERIWAEFEKGLTEPYLDKMSSALVVCGAYNVKAIVPYAAFSNIRSERLSDTTPIVRFAAGSGNFIPNDYKICKIPISYSRVGLALAKHKRDLINWLFLSINDCVRVFTEMKVFSDKQLIIDTISALQLTLAYSIAYEIHMIKEDLHHASTIDATAIASSCSDPSLIASTIFKARAEAILAGRQRE